MALLRNGTNLYSNSSRPFGALGAATIRSAFGDGGGGVRNRIYGWHTITDVTDRSSQPTGCRPPVCWFLAQKSGGLASRNISITTVTASTPILEEGRGLVGSASVTVTVPDAQLNLIVNAVGSATVTVTTNTPALGGVVSISGDSTVTISTNTPTLGALVNAVGSSTITVSSSATLTAIGYLEGSTESTTELTADGIAESVWTRLIAGLPAHQIMQILDATQGGKMTVVGNTVTFRDSQDTIDRLVATMSGANRGAIVINFDP